MKVSNIMAIICGVTVLSTPLANASASSLTPSLPANGSADASAAKTDKMAEQLLHSAMSEFRDHESKLSVATIKQIVLHKEELIPFVKAGVSIAPERIHFNPWSKGYVYEEWSFWIELAKQLRDERLLPVLLHWTADKRYVPDSDVWMEAVEALLPQGKENELLSLLDQANANGVNLLLTIYAKRKPITDQQMEEWLKRYVTSPNIGGFVSVIAVQPNGNERLKKLFGTRKGATGLDRAIVVGIDFDKDREWLTRIAKSTADPWIEQTIDMNLAYEHGDQDAVRRLFESGEKSGYQVQIGGPVEKLIIASYPDGMLARGIKQYEKITGKPYFYGGDDEEWYKAKGADYDQPQVGITQWQAFRKAFPNHPAADDAAYRLARCYQISGQYDQALVWFEQAMNSGDSDMGYNASGQFLFVMDVNMGQTEFAQLEKTAMPDWKHIWLRYSKAVDLLRANQYDQAASELQLLIKAYDGTDVFADSVLKDTWTDYSDAFAFWDNVKKQLETAKKLAKVKQAIEQATGVEKARKQYELAADIFHDEFTYYNYLWSGQRQSFFWIGQVRDMEYSKSLDQYVGRLNNLLQAAEQFAAIELDQADAETGAKALYSQALSYSKLTGYGTEVAFHSTQAMLIAQLLETGEKLLKRYPESELADDTLLLMYHYSHELGYLERLLKQYPKGDQAALAKRLQKEAQSAKNTAYKRPNDFLSSLPYQTLSEEDWRTPASIKKWAEVSSGGKRFEGTIEENGWTYFLINLEKNATATLMNLEVDRNNCYVIYKINNPAINQKTQGKQGLLVRVPSRFLPKGQVTFQQRDR